MKRPKTGRLRALRRRIRRRRRKVPAPPASVQPMRPWEAFRRLLRSVIDEEGLTVARRPAAAKIARATSDEGTRSVLEDELVAGTSAPRALVACVRTLVRHRNFDEAHALMTAARRMARLREAGQAAAVVIAVARARFPAAENHLRNLRRESALRLVPAELVAVEFATHNPAAVDTGATVLGTSAELDPESWLDLARHTFARGEPDLSERALSRIGASGASVPRHVGVEARWLEHWIARARADRKPGPVLDGRVALAVLDYKQPDYRRVYANLGDYIQTVASLGHLVRHQDLRFHGDADLVGRLTALRARVRTEERLRGVERDITVVAVNRDATSLDTVPEGTWMLAFGWYMHNWFKVRYDFPFHPHLRPVFISFHISHRGILSEECVTYLRERAPIGCRDWDTVHRLLRLGIPAFFSGCLTSTVDLLFPAEPPRPSTDAPIALIDLPPGSEHPHTHLSIRLSHAGVEVRDAGLPANMDRAVRMLESYRRDFSGVVTSRLHCYLPARALGVDVRFQPRREGDVRFDGLVGIDDASFAAMQQGICDKLQAVLSCILRGDDEQTVRATWRDVCAPDVEAARRRHRATLVDEDVVRARLSLRSPFRCEAGCAGRCGSRPDG